MVFGGVIVVAWGYLGTFGAIWMLLEPLWGYCGYVGAWLGHSGPISGVGRGGITLTL